MRRSHARAFPVRSAVLSAITFLVACSTQRSTVAPVGAPLLPALVERIKSTENVATNPSVEPLQSGLRVLITFHEGPKGGEPFAGLVRDDAGNLYGTTLYGGDQACSNGIDTGCGVVFKMDAGGRETVLHAFVPGTSDGQYPQGRVILDRAGNLYGTTAGGGAGCAGGGCGTAFKIDASGNESLLHSFSGGQDGTSPAAGLVRDSAGNLYGTTFHGGGSGCHDVDGDGCGVVFKVSSGGAETVLHRFTGADGAIPVGDLLLDAAGNIYGTTWYGGAGACNDGFETGCGTVFELNKNGQESVLYSFSSGSQDGGGPRAGLLADSAGNFYGTAYYGGDLSCKLRTLPGCGVVFELDKSGKESVLHKFEGGTDGAFPLATLVSDAAGNLYGTASWGGKRNCPQRGQPGCGVVFKLSRTNQETILYRFTNGADGETPVAGVVRDAAGNMFGTTLIGTANYGAVFELNSADALLPLRAHAAQQQRIDDDFSERVDQRRRKVVDAADVDGEVEPIRAPRIDQRA